MRLHDNFEWDEAKAEKNLRKHRVSFDEAALVLADEDGEALHVGGIRRPAQHWRRSVHNDRFAPGRPQYCLDYRLDGSIDGTSPGHPHYQRTRGEAGGEKKICQRNHGLVELCGNWRATFRLLRPRISTVSVPPCGAPSILARSPSDGRFIVSSVIPKAGFLHERASFARPLHGKCAIFILRPTGFGNLRVLTILRCPNRLFMSFSRDSDNCNYLRLRLCSPLCSSVLFE